MKITKQFDVNCSEATIRIDVSEIKEEVAWKILDELRKKFDSSINQDIFESEVDMGFVFGKRIITIKGDYPHNNKATITKVLDEKKLKYEYEGE